MKHWIIGLLLVGIAIPLITSQNSDNDDEDYEIKRFHVQSRQLNGRSQCVETRRKRSNRQADLASQTSNEEDYEEEPNDEETAIGVSTGGGNPQQESTGLLIRDTDLAENAGILVIQNGVPPNSPVLFELRPVPTAIRDAYLEDEDDPDAPEEDSDFENNTDDMENNDNNENNDNRYKPNNDLDSDEYEETPPKRKRVRTTKKPKRKRPSEDYEAENSDEDEVKPNKKKRKRPSSQPSRTKPKPSRRKNKNRNSNRNKNKNKNKNRNKKKRRNGYRKESNENNVRRKNLKKKVNVRRNRLGEHVNKGSGAQTITNTMTTTQTGTGGGDVNCIIINKQGPPAIQRQRPFWDILGRSTGDKQEDRSFGLRKRIKHKIFA